MTGQTAARVEPACASEDCPVFWSGHPDQAPPPPVLGPPGNAIESVASNCKEKKGFQAHTRRRPVRLQPESEPLPGGGDRFRLEIVDLGPEKSQLDKKWDYPTMPMFIL